jgi:hypothetical protein
VADARSIRALRSCDCLQPHPEQSYAWRLSGQFNGRCAADTVNSTAEADRPLPLQSGIRPRNTSLTASTGRQSPANPPTDRCLSAVPIWANPLRGPGCRASHRAPSLRSVSRPYRASIPFATRPGRLRRRSSRGRPFPRPGSRALMSVAGTRPTGPLGELTRCSRTALRSTALRFASCAAHVPDRHPATRQAPEPGRLNAKRAPAGSPGAPVAALRSA